MPLEALHNEKELLSRVAGGDRQAFTRLYTEYYPLVQQYVALFEPSKDSREELTQDIFVRIWDKRALLADVDSFRNYLFLTTRNFVLNYIKAMKMQRKFSELDASGETEAGEDTEKEFQFKQCYQLFLEALGKMPRGMHNVLKMSVEQGLSLDEIAGALKISKAGVKKQLVKAKAFVREYLREHAELSLLLFIFLSLFKG